MRQDYVKLIEEEAVLRKKWQAGIISLLASDSIDNNLVLNDLQPVAHPWFCDNMNRPTWIRLDLAAQVADIDLQHVLFTFVGSSPDGT
jgi:hypothetical protein